MACKKKLYKLNPNRRDEKFLIQRTKIEKAEVLFTEKHNEQYSREILANKLSGTHVGIWLLIPEYLRLGAWDLLKGCFQDSCDNSLHTRLGLQLVNESAMCINRMRRKDSLCNQGFSLASGLPYLATDEAIHKMLDSHTMMDYEQVQIALMQIRKLEGHYHKEQIFALDPHRLNSVTQRMMPSKKKKPDQPAQKIMQTFFCIDAISGQPLGNYLGSSGKTTSSATMRLMHMIEQGGINSGLFIADKEHFTQEIISYFYNHQSYDILMPAPQNKNITNRFTELEYTKLWAGYSIATADFKFEGSKEKLRLLIQRQGESAGSFYYKAFITTSCLSPELLLADLYPKRWTIEEFFNFHGEMGWNRASTFNLNIKYGKQTMAMIAQAAVHQLKRKLPIEYQSWTAPHTANQLFANMEGDIRVDKDTIIVTYYRDHQNLNLKQHFENLPSKLQAEGVNPKIPWLYDFKIDFRFK
ncbi:MAG TPA: transposase [Saprospiraceae bacterium]|nr:transposase [Saprospiraceae bacterium]